MPLAALTTVYVGVGSNLDPEKNILQAFTLLTMCAPVSKTSTFYRTAALGTKTQADFINGVWEIKTNIEARTLKFSVLREIEATLGRRRSADKNAPREIDLDILLFGETCIDEADLKIPEREIAERIFLSAPLYEVAGELLLPGTPRTLSSLIDKKQKMTLNAVEGLTRQLHGRISREH